MSIVDILGENGVFSKKLDGFRARPQQLKLADAISDVIHEQNILIAEAGTGTGKTFAYLVPAFLSGKKVIISTGTKTLQDQLFYRDIPQVSTILEVSPKVRLLKGRSNYLCLYRFDKTRYSKLAKLPENASVIEEINGWIRTTAAGEVNELERLPEKSPLRFQLTSTPENCLGQECEYYSECFVYRARRRALDADVLVVNHHLLFADMAIKQGGFGEILPKTDVLVLDESHQIPDVAGRFFSQSFTSRQCQELLKDLMTEAGGVSAAFAAITDQHQWMEQALRDVFLSFSQAPAKGTMQQLLANPRLKEPLDLLLTSLDDLQQACAEIAVQSQGLESCYLRLTGVHALLQDILANDDDQFVFWFENRNKYFSLNKSPLNVAEPLRDFRNQLDVAWVLTSATLTVNQQFEHYQQLTGFDEAQTLLLDSPFDYHNNALLLLPKTLPEPNDYHFNQQMFRYVQPIIEQSPGGVFFLFTSHRSLQAAAEYFSRHLNKAIFIQGTQDRNRLLEDFRECGNGLLLGAASFWEGVDVSGQNLSCVIIDKLPFAHPDDPVLQAKISDIRKNGGNPFYEHQLPKAAISLKQGAGRLIRGEQDNGVLVICDKRITGKSYGQVFLNSLPDMRITDNKEQVLSFFDQIR